MKSAAATCGREVPLTIHDRPLYQQQFPFSGTSRTTGVNEVLALYHATGSAARWPFPIGLESAREVVYRNDFISKLVQRSVPDILEAYVYFSVADMKRLMKLVRRYLLPRDLEGVGLDLGSGSGLLASVVASNRKVKAVLAIEVCERAASLLIPKVATWVLGRKADKVVPVIGSFDNLQLPDNSIDFIVEIDSFHHADDLSAIMAECARVLKPGGWLLAFDRCWPNKHPDSDLERLLGVVYSREFLIANGYPPDVTLTRRENGEHEYKLFQWQQSFETAGLALNRMCKFNQEVTARQALKGLLSVLPVKLRRIFFSTDNATLKTSRAWLSQKLQTMVREIKWGREISRPCHWPQQNMFGPRETTAFLLPKKALAPPSGRGF